MSRNTLLCAGLLLCVALLLPLRAAAQGGIPLELISPVEPSGWSLVYGDALQQISLYGRFRGQADSIEVFGSLEWDAPGAVPPAGGYTAFYTFTPDNGAYAPYHGSLELTVERRGLHVTGAEVADRAYDGDTVAEIRSFSLAGSLPGDDVAVSYSAAFQSEGVGEGKPVEVIFLGLTGADAGNYSLLTPGLTAQGSILKYTGASCAPVSRELKAAASIQSIMLPAAITLTGPGSPGAVEYVNAVTVRGDDLFLETPVVAGDLLEFLPADNLPEGRSATVTFPVRSDNYADVYAEIHFTVGGKQAVAVAGISVRDKTYDGAPVLAEGVPVMQTAGGTETLSGAVYHYTGDGGYDSPEPPVNAGSYRLVVSVPPDHPSRTGDSGPIDFAILPAALTITPDDKVIQPGTPLPESGDYSFRYEHLAAGETPEAVLSPMPVAGSALSASLPGASADIVIVNEPRAVNYSIVKGAGTLTVATGAVDDSYYNAPAANAAGWHNTPILLTPARPDLFDTISLSGAADSFGPSALLEEETGEGSAGLYFGNGSAVLGPVPFLYRLDRTPPVIESAVVQPAGGVLTVAAVDALSGVSDIRVTGTDGGDVPGSGGVFIVPVGGVYTVTVADYAGNTVSATYSIPVEEGGGDSTGDGGDDDGSGDDNATTWKPPTGSSVTPSASSATASRRSRSSSSSGGGASPTGDEAFWREVEQRIRAAEQGATIRVISSRGDRIPIGVLKALRDRGVTLRLIRLDGDVLLAGPRLPALDEARSAYTIDELLRDLLAESDDEEPALPEGPPQYLPPAPAAGGAASATYPYTAALSPTQIPLVPIEESTGQTPAPESAGTADPASLEAAPAAMQESAAPVQQLVVPAAKRSLPFLQIFMVVSALGMVAAAVYTGVKNK